MIAMTTKSSTSVKPAELDRMRVEGTDRVELDISRPRANNADASLVELRFVSPHRDDSYTVSPTSRFRQIESMRKRAQERRLSVLEQ